jgi:hypothetical protein
MSPNKGKKLRLHKDCIFVQLEKPGDTEPRAVVLRHKPKNQQFNHYTPLNQSACLVLDLLTKHAHKAGKGTDYDEIVDQLVLTFSVTRPVAQVALDEFLADLKTFDLLEEQHGSDNVYPDPIYTPRPGEPRGRIQEGGTLICCGNVINWWRP